jgi:hypothetical protein
VFRQRHKACGNYESKFLVKSATGTWTVLCDYGPGGMMCYWNTWDSNQWPAGKYTVQVMARSMGSGTEYDVLKNMDFIISRHHACNLGDLAANVTSPAERQPVMFSAAAQAGQRTMNISSW